MTDRSKIGRNNKARGKAMERDVAARIGGKRHPADQGGGEDISHPELVIQCKSGLTVVTQIIRDGMASAKAAAVDQPGKLPCVVAIDRKGTRLGRYIIFELDPWAAHHGYGLNGECSDESG